MSTPHPIAALIREPGDGVLRWEEPPASSAVPRGEQRIAWAIIASQLKARSGKWGVVYEGPPMPKMTQRIAQGLSPWFRPAGTFEATQRSRRGVVTVYARYVGGGAS